MLCLLVLCSDGTLCGLLICGWFGAWLGCFMGGVIALSLCLGLMLLLMVVSGVQIVFCFCRLCFADPWVVV